MNDESIDRGPLTYPIELYETEDGPGLLLSWQFWVGGLVGLLLWTALCYVYVF